MTNGLTTLLRTRLIPLYASPQRTSRRSAGEQEAEKNSNFMWLREESHAYLVRLGG